MLLQKANAVCRMTIALTMRAVTDTLSKDRQSRSAVQSCPQGASLVKKAENGIRVKGVRHPATPKLVGPSCKQKL